MGRQGYGRWIVVVTWVALVQYVHGSGKLDILFRAYSGNGKDSGGNCCDSIFPWGCNDNPCDPYFIICVDRIGGSTGVGDCSIFRIQTGAYHEKNWIVFDGSLAGVANPLVISAVTVPVNYNIKVDVYDTDPANSHDHIDSLLKGILDLRPTANGVKGGYRQVRLSNTDRAVLDISVRSYCDADWYSDSCTKRCKDNEYGHYTCNKQTGDKICTTGWKGDNCNVDINECNKDYCKNGADCTNFGGGFSCDCEEGFKGTLCDETTHECVINPCMNGGTCHGNETTSFTCECLPWWGGETCKEEVDPCDVEPCHNNATCIFNKTITTGFTCYCGSDWTGEICDVKVETTTSTTTPTPTTTTTSVITFGDPYYVSLLGVIDQTNLQDLIDGLINLINDLGGIEGRVYVKVTPEIIPINPGVTITRVEFSSADENGAINVTDIHAIFTSHSDDTISGYLPLPLYRPVVEAQIQDITWVKSNWYILVVAVALVLIAFLMLFLFISKVKKIKSKDDPDSSIQEVNTANMSYDNVTYQEAYNQRRSVIVDDAAVTFTTNEKPRFGELPKGGAFTDDPNPYSIPALYDTPIKHPPPMIPGYGVKPYENCKVTILDTRGKTGTNDYTNFNNLSTNQYEDLDDVIAQKVALAVGVPYDVHDDVSIDYTDDEDDIDKMKAKLEDDQTEA